MASAKAKQKTETDATPEPATIIAYKGFDANLRCRGFQFEIGKSYEHAGAVVACASGFHACEHPLNVFRYYPPARSRYAEVALAGAMSRHDSDTKVTAAKITINAELSIGELTKRAIDWVFSRAKWSDGPVAAEPNGGATASGEQGAATASGYQGAATASDSTSVAHASGFSGKVRGVEGAALHLDRRNDNGIITHAWAGIVGRDNLKPMTWYTLDENGRPVECE